MTKTKAGNNKFLKQLNQTSVLDHIRSCKAVSRAQLSELTGLSATATGMIVSDLLAMGYIHETGEGASKGGRRPVLLELKPRSFYSLGFDVEVNVINTILVDITGRTLYESSEAIQSTADIDSVINFVSDSVIKISKEFSIQRERLLGIGISVAGMIDSETRRVVLAPNLGWEDVDMANRLKQSANVPVFVENEAMASAICENWLGSCQDINNFVCINVSSGIGAGIFTGGKLYRGASGSAGEVGHIVVDENGPRCGCGNYGCLETLASTTRIVEKTRKLVKQGTVSSLNSTDNADNIQLDDIIDAAGAGDEFARNILMESARYIGIAISNIVNTLNPSRIVVGKEFSRYAGLVMAYLNGIVAGKALRSPASKVEIIQSEIGEKASTLGAAIIPLKNLFGR